MPVRSGKEAQARTLYAQGITVTDIAKRLELARPTITRYKALDRGTDNDWDKLKADLKGKAPKPKLISFERPRGENKTSPKAGRGQPSDRSLPEKIDDAIDAVIELLLNADNLQGVGGAASGMVSLVHLKLELESEEHALQTVMEKFKTPRELAAKLRELGWARETA